MFDDFQLGDVIITQAARFRLQDEFRNEPFNGQSFRSTIGALATWAVIAGL